MHPDAANPVWILVAIPLMICTLVLVLGLLEKLGSDGTR